MHTFIPIHWIVSPQVETATEFMCQHCGFTFKRGDTIDVNSSCAYDLSALVSQAEAQRQLNQEWEQGS